MKAEELIVALKAENADETIGEVEGVENSINETADSMSETADSMDDLNQAWTGAMGSMVASLTVSTGFLLSRVPVLEGTMQAFGSILSAIGFQLDGLLRPAFSRINSILYRVNEAIFNAEGAWGTLIGTLTLAATALISALGGLLSYVAATQGLTAAIGLLATALKGVLVTIGSFIASVVSVPVLIGAAIAAIVLLAWHFREEIVDAIQTAIGWMGNFASKIAGLAKSGAAFIGNLAQAFGEKVVEIGKAIKEIAMNITDTIKGLINDAYQWGRELIQELIDGIRSKVEDVGAAMEDVAQSARDRMPGSPAERGPLSDIDQSGPGLVDEFASGIRGNIGQVESAATEMADSATGSDFRASRTETTKIFMDGRRVDEQTGRYGKGKTIRRGL